MLVLGKMEELMVSVFFFSFLFLFSVLCSRPFLLILPQSISVFKCPSLEQNPKFSGATTLKINSVVVDSVTQNGLVLGGVVRGKITASISGSATIGAVASCKACVYTPYGEICTPEPSNFFLYYIIVSGLIIIITGVMFVLLCLCSFPTPNTRPHTRQPFPVT